MLMSKNAGSVRAAFRFGVEPAEGPSRGPVLAPPPSAMMTVSAAPHHVAGNWGLADGHPDARPRRPDGLLTGRSGPPVTGQLPGDRSVPPGIDGRMVPVMSVLQGEPGTVATGAAIPLKALPGA